MPSLLRKVMFTYQFQLILPRQLKYITNDDLLTPDITKLGQKNPPVISQD